VAHASVALAIAIQIPPNNQPSRLRFHFELELTEAGPTAPTRRVKVDENREGALATALLSPMAGVVVVVEFAASRVASGLPHLGPLRDPRDEWRQSLSDGSHQTGK